MAELRSLVFRIGSGPEWARICRWCVHSGSTSGETVGSGVLGAQICYS